MYQEITVDAHGHECMKCKVMQKVLSAEGMFSLIAVSNEELQLFEE